MTLIAGGGESSNRYQIDIFSRNVNIMFEAVILGKGKVSQKLDKCRKLFVLFYSFSGHVFHITFIRNM